MLARTQAQGRFFPSLIETRNQALLVQMADNAIHWINLYPLDSAIGFPNHPLNSELSGFDRLPWPVDSAMAAFAEQQGPEIGLGSFTCKFWVETNYFVTASISFSFPDSSVYVAAEFLHYSVFLALCLERKWFPTRLAQETIHSKLSSYSVPLQSEGQAKVKKHCPLHFGSRMCQY